MRDDKSRVILSIQRPYVLTVNPDVDVDGCPLVAYVSQGDWELYDHVLASICQGDNDEQYFSGLPKDHMRQARDIFEDEESRNRVIKLAKFVRDDAARYAAKSAPESAECSYDSSTARAKAGMEMFRGSAEVGRHVMVTYDGPTVCFGRVTYITDTAVGIWPDAHTSSNTEPLRISGDRLSKPISLAENYIDLIYRRKESLLSSVSIYDTVEMECMDKVVIGTLLEILSDALVVRTNTGKLCVPFLWIRTLRNVTDAAKLKWCRENAPDAAKDLPDIELLELMSDAYLDMIRDRVIAEATK